MRVMALLAALLISCGTARTSTIAPAPSPTRAVSTQAAVAPPTPSPTPTPDLCAAGRAYLALTGNNLSTTVRRVENRDLAMTAAVDVLALMGGELLMKELPDCVAAGKDAMLDVIAARRDAYRHFIAGQIAQARADLDAEEVALQRYAAWRGR